MPRFIVLAVLALAIVGSVSSSTAARHGRSRYTPPPPQPPADLYCLQGRSWGYPGSCLYATYEQCKATASGMYAYCGINPVWAFRGWRQE